MGEVGVADAGQAELLHVLQDREAICPGAHLRDRFEDRGSSLQPGVEIWVVGLGDQEDPAWQEPLEGQFAGEDPDHFAECGEVSDRDRSGEELGDGDISLDVVDGRHSRYREQAIEERTPRVGVSDREPVFVQHEVGPVIA